MALIGEMHYLTIGGNTYSIPTSGGSTVSVTRTLTSGTKTATISVDGTSYDLYAPTPNAGTITSVKTTAGAHTTINVSSGSASFNIPTKTSHLTNDSGFITSYTETDPVFSSSAAAGITSTDISNWNAKVSDDKTWNGVSLNKTIYANSTTYILPFVTSASATEAKLVNASATPTAKTIAVYDTNAYLKSTTPPASDSSTNAATTAYVTNAISAISIPTKTSDLTNDSGFLTSSDIASVLRYKGTKAIVSALPTSGNTTGDVWHVTADGSEWAWDGSTWQELGTAIDLSGYAQLAGASFTGPVTFGDSVTMDEVTIGDLVVNGAASFTNNIQANTINGVTVGSSPKFTDTVVSKTSQLTNDSGFLTSYTETDPVFSASAAAGITATDINNWNGKSSTDEKVKATALTFDDNEYYPIFGDSSGIAKTKNYTTAFGIGCSSTYNRIDLKLGTASIAGQITLYRGQDSNRYATIKINTITGGRIITIPDKTGTIALTSDIPSVYSSTNTGGYLTMATLPIYNGTVV